MITTGFIGNGKSTNRYHMPFILKTGKFKVKTIYNRSIKDDWAKVEGADYTTDLDVLLNDPEIELVVVTTPLANHYESAKKALLAGKHVLLEKPFTRTLAEAQELFDLAREKGLMLQGYHNRRFDSDFLTSQKVIASGKLGNLQEIEMHFDYFRPEIPESVNEFSVDASFLYNHGCHTLDQVISYFGKPDQVHFDLRQLLGDNRMNDYFDIDLTYGDLKVSVKSSYFRLKERPSFVLYGDKGTFIKETKDRQEEDLKKFYLPDHADFGLDRPQDYGVLSYMEDGQYHEEKVVSEVGDYSLFYEALYETLANGAEPLVKEEQTLLLMTLLEEGIASLEN
ncbi:Gfo/Idh/MocA family oxidoreductase [Streptococcus hyovaginalis]|uniref:Gfo/Idh/MocA family oxidoreductase n=2 Tax=Streptococcus hyovaginalis TaxID=149015 RepID=UPI002A90E794|nr:Gfo/Idh/MocA family oxidoreductase [Streptococcus hyovaginalis]MDY5973455.1 Gfo/Idh/MocA family oxidoreductase [Streptococcus hyovaginalis]